MVPRLLLLLLLPACLFDGVRGWWVELVVGDAWMDGRMATAKLHLM
jgi:hypothetical protein